jgi:tetratricopeptide (TPR) repeat protein
MRSAVTALLLVFPLTAVAQTPTPTPASATSPVAVATPAAQPTALASANPVPPQALPRLKRPGEQSVTPTGALWRSVVLPGWGQRYKGERTKGWILTGLTAGLAGGTLAGYEYAELTRHQYKALPQGTSEGTFNRDYQRSVQASVGFEFLAGLTAAVWTANVADSAFSPVAPIRIKEARVKDVFPAMNKYYETNPVATISIENRSSDPVNKVKVKFEAKDIMDLPAESEVVDSIPPGLGKSFAITAAFNKRIFDVGASEPKEVPAKITIEYETGHKSHTQISTATFTVYNRNAIVWDDMRKLASFVTPREDTVKAFQAAVITKKPAISNVRSISNAAAFFDAMGVYGINYVSDPQAPFQYFENNAEAVDTVNFPFETLGRKAGDCDDLTSLYASLLESAGIATALVDVPGHVFVMFDSGMSPDEMRDYLGSDSGFYPRNGSAWVPVEITAVGKPFNQAWALGAQEVKKFAGLNQLNMVDTVSSQAEFPPSPPPGPSVPDDIAKLDGAKLASLAAEDQAKLGKSEAQAQSKAIADVKARHLSPAAEENEIGIVFAKDGKYDEAVKHFNQAKSIDPHLAKAYNNLANIAYLKGDLEGAGKQYRDALDAGGDNPAILANLANIYYEQGDAKNAKLYFERALRIEPMYASQYPEINALVQKGADASGGKVAANDGSHPAVGKAAGVGLDKDPRKAKWIP